MSWFGLAWSGLAVTVGRGRVLAGRVGARWGKAWQSRFVKASPGEVRQGNVGQSRQGMVRLGVVQLGMVRHGMAVRVSLGAVSSGGVR